MSGRRLAAGLLALCVGVAAAAAADVALALRVPTDSPQLRALADAWRGRWSELRTAIAGTDPQRRRGAARLAGGAGAPPAELLAALLATGDVEAQRLGLSALREVDALPPGELLRLGDAGLACLLLGRQTADPFATPAVATRVSAWLRDPATCVPAAELCCARGSAAGCGQALLAALAVEDETVVGAAHAALCVLTRTQRSRAVYAGHHDLLVKDWRDALAAAPAVRSEPSPELAALVADLPAAAALGDLLGRGPAALAAVEHAMEGAEKPRRRELAVAARLLARDVSPALWRSLGADGFEGMDDPKPRARLAALARAAEAVRTAKDGPGLLHLLSYADDRDPLVRASAFDRLVRLSDQRREFTGDAGQSLDWEMGDGGLFPPGRTLHRLRRSLAAGAADEQISALQFIASLSAGDLGADVAALLLSPSAVVVDTALETLAHLGSTDQAEALLRLAQDASQPVSRRVRVLGMLDRPSYSFDGQRGVSAELLASLERLAAGQPPAVALAARKAWIGLGQDQDRRRAALTTMLADPAQRAAALTLIHEKFATDAAGDPPLAALVVPHVRAEDPALASLAAESLLRSLDERKLAAKVPGWFDDAARADLARLDRADGRRLALALRLGLVERPRALELGKTLPPDGRSTLARALLVGRDPLAALGEVAELMGDEPADGILSHAALRAAKTALLLQRPLLEELGRVGALDVIPTETSSSDRSGRTHTRTLLLEDGRTLVFEAASAADDDEEAAFDFGADDERLWTLAKAPEPLADAAGAAALAAALDRLRLAEGQQAEREVLLAIAVGRPLPASAEAALADEPGAWRLLASRDPALRARLVDQVNAKPPSIWTLRRLIRRGEPDLLPAVAKVLVAERETYLIGPLLGHLASLPPATVSPHLPDLLANPLVARHESLAPLLAAAPLPVRCLPTLVRTHPGAAATFAAFTREEAEAIAPALLELDEAAVLGGANLMRAARASAPASFDPVLRALVERGDARAAAWLRTGLPLAAGMGDLYDRALEATDPDVWLVGAAKALKEGRLDASAFVARVGAIPPSAQAKAALVATRYLDGKLAAEGAGLARIVATCPAKALPSWIALLPPDPAIGTALAARAGEATTAGLIGIALDARLRADRARWQPVVQVVVAGAHGRLDHLMPR